MTTRSHTAVVGQAEILCTLNRDFYHASVLEYCTEHGVLVGSDVYLGRASECPANRALSPWRSAGECDYFRSDAASIVVVRTAGRSAVQGVVRDLPARNPAMLAPKGRRGKRI
jgi:hypothetical protein